MQVANDDLAYLAFRFDGTEAHALGMLPFANSSVALAINDAGIIVGFSTNTVGHHVPGVERDYLPATAVMWRNGEIEDLGLGAFSSRAEDVNDLGQVIGVHWPEGTGPGVAFLKVIDGPWQSLGPIPGGVTSDARAINNRGQIVGFGNTIDSAARPFLWERGELTLLSSLPGQRKAVARDISDDGLIVGDSWSPGDRKAVLWDDGNVYDLNALIPPGFGVELQIAWMINASGQIVVQGWASASASYVAVLLTPLHGDVTCDSTTPPLTGGDRTRPRTPRFRRPCGRSLRP